MNSNKIIMMLMNPLLLQHIEQFDDNNDSSINNNEEVNNDDEKNINNDDNDNDNDKNDTRNDRNEKRILKSPLTRTNNNNNNNNELDNDDDYTSNYSRYHYYWNKILFRLKYYINYDDTFFLTEWNVRYHSITIAMMGAVVLLLIHRPLMYYSIDIVSMLIGSLLPIIILYVEPALSEYNLSTTTTILNKATPKLETTLQIPTTIDDSNNNDNNSKHIDNDEIIINIDSIISTKRQVLSQILGSIGAPPLINHLSISNVVVGTSSSSSSISCSLLLPIDRIRIIETNLNQLEELCIVHCNLIQTIHEVLNVIKIGTSIRFGLGIPKHYTPHSTTTIERIERSAIGRQQQQQQQSMTAPLMKIKSSLRLSSSSLPSSSSLFQWPLITFPILRLRLYTILDRQLLLLDHMMMMSLSSLPNKHDCNDNIWNQPVLEEREESYSGGVITLSVLRSLKSELINTLSDTVAKYYSDLNNNNPGSELLFRKYCSKVIASAVESNTYLRSLLDNMFSSGAATTGSTGVRNITDNNNYSSVKKDTNNEVHGSVCSTVREINNDIQSIRQIMNTLQITLAAAVASNTTNTNECYCKQQQQHQDSDDTFVEWKNTMVPWYDEFYKLNLVYEQLVTKINERMELLRTMEYVGHKTRTIDNEKVNNKNENSELRSTTVANVTLEYSATTNDSTTTGTKLHAKVGDDISTTQQQRSKVLVFTGQGVTEPSRKSIRYENNNKKKKKKGVESTSSSLTGPITTTNYYDCKVSLIEELRNHMKAMPSLEEELVINHDAVATTTITEPIIDEDHDDDNEMVRYPSNEDDTNFDNQPVTNNHYSCSPIFPVSIINSSSFLQDLKQLLPQVEETNDDIYIS